MYMGSMTDGYTDQNNEGVLAGSNDPLGRVKGNDPAMRRATRLTPSS
jgi:hypothetical protein